MLFLGMEETPQMNLVKYINGLHIGLRCNGYATGRQPAMGLSFIIFHKFNNEKIARELAEKLSGYTQLDFELRSIDKNTKFSITCKFVPSDEAQLAVLKKNITDNASSIGHFIDTLRNRDKNLTETMTCSVTGTAKAPENHGPKTHEPDITKYKKPRLLKIHVPPAGSHAAYHRDNGFKPRPQRPGDNIGHSPEK